MLIVQGFTTVKPNVDCKYGLYKEFLNERQSTLGNLLPYIEELNGS